MSLGDRLIHAILLGIVALTLVVVGVPMLTVGLLLAFGGTYWIAVAGFVVVACGAAIFLGARRAQAQVRRERATRPGPTRAFVSYRTAEHGECVPRIAAALREQGIVVHVAPSDAMGPDPDRPWTVLRAFGLFQSGDLDADLQRWLLESDALVYCVPSQSRQVSFGRRLKDTVDGLLAHLLFESGLSKAFWRHFWQLGVYGKSVTPAARLFDLESWQRWELRTARELGLEVIPVALGDVAVDVEGVRLRPHALEVDVRERVMPKLEGVRRPPPEMAGVLPVVGLVVLIFVGVVTLLLLIALPVAVFLIIRALF